MPETRPRKLRWWPAAAILALSVAAHLWIWLGPEPTRQVRMIRTFVGLFVTVVLLVLWFAFFSRLRWRVRLAGLAIVAVVALAWSQMVEIRGVTGDLRPILAWTWSPRDADLARPAAAGESAPAAGGPAAAGAAHRADFPQFLGPARDAILPGVRLDPDWRARPPRQLWRREIGAGWASFAVVGDLAVTQEQRGAEELVTAYDLATGEPRWVHADAARFETTVGGIGPRATPTVAGGRVYAMGATGILNALDLASGERLWTRDVPRETGGFIPEWGKSCSPLVVDGRVVVSAGGFDGRSLVAYDADTGELAWGGGDDASSYSSPMLATLAGVRQILIVNAGSLAAHDPATGEVLWSHPWSAEQPNVAQPLVLSGDRVMLSKGYGHGSEMIRVSRAADGAFAVASLWKSPRLKLKFTNAVVHDGTIYGLDDGVLVGLDPETGERRWKRGRYGHGQLLLAGGLLLIQAESGDVLLVEPSAEGPRELARFEAFDSKTWNVPTLAGRFLLVRNDREAALYELAAAG